MILRIFLASPAGPRDVSSRQDSWTFATTCTCGGCIYVGLDVLSMYEKERERDRERETERKREKREITSALKITLRAF